MFRHVIPALAIFTFSGGIVLAEDTNNTVKQQGKINTELFCGTISAIDTEKKIITVAQGYEVDLKNKTVVRITDEKKKTVIAFPITESSIVVIENELVPKPDLSKVAVGTWVQVGYHKDGDAIVATKILFYMEDPVAARNAANSSKETKPAAK